jgi:hypothetical protein
MTISSQSLQQVELNKDSQFIEQGQYLNVKLYLCV